MPTGLQAPKATEFGEITRRLGLLRPSRSSKVTEFGTNRKLICDLLLVINSNLAPILHRFRDIAFDRSKIAIFGYSSCIVMAFEIINLLTYFTPVVFNSPDGGIPLGRSP